MTPSPASGAGSHARAWQAGQSARGGISSAPHLVQRIPVSSPSRTRSKKRLSVTAPGSVTAEQAHADGRGVAAEGVGEALPGALDLAGAGILAELRDDLADLRGARRADRMPFRLESAGDVHRDLAAEARQALGDGAPPGAGLEEAQPLGGDDLPDG